MKTETHILPEHWASYIINGDASSFSLYDDEDEEIGRIDAYLETINGYCVDVSKSSFFSWHCDAPNELAGTMAEYTFIILRG